MQLVIIKDIHERKMLMNEMSEGFIILTGGFGTLREFFEVLTWAQLGLHTKPIEILNIEDFYHDLMNMLQNMVNIGFVKQEAYNMILEDNDVANLLLKKQK